MSVDQPWQESAIDAIDHNQVVGNIGRSAVANILDQATRYKNEQELFQMSKPTNMYTLLIRNAGMRWKAIAQ